MNRMLVILTISILLVTSGCSAGNAGSPAAAATTVPPTSMSQPTDTAAAPAAAAATETPSSGCPASYNGNFTDASMVTCWDATKPVIVTSKAPAQNTIKDDVDAIDFKFNAAETYGYVVYGGGPYSNGVVLSAVATSLKNNSSSMVLACNITDDGWFEARVSFGGLYSIYRYESALKAAGKNPYVGDYVEDKYSNVILVGAGRTNDVTISCVGSQFTLTVNGTKLFDQSLPEMKNGGSVGIGSIIHDKPPLEIRFTSFTVQPQS